MSKPGSKVFVDSDVVISAVISEKGAAAQLLGGQPGVETVISDASQKESRQAGKRLGLDVKRLDQVLGEPEVYVMDLGDAHVVAGAAQSKSRFLITYNLRHYDVEKIKRELNILVMSPGKFLQYLRSLS